MDRQKYINSVANNVYKSVSIFASTSRVRRSKMITESIFNGERHDIPLADVGYIDKLGLKKGEIKVVLKGWENNKFGMPNNNIFLHDNEAKEFIKAWKIYRHEKDGAKNERN